MNQYYSEELSQKTKRGLNESRLKGNFCGGTVTYGYALNGQKVVINEQETHIVQQIFNDYAAGKQAIAIARDLYDRGVLYRGNNFRIDTVYRILRQEKYIGIYRVNDTVYDKIYPPIVPVEVYNVVKARIYGKHPKNNVNYLLKGKVICGYCGKHMISFAGTSKSGEMRRYYRCHKYDFCEQSRTVQKDVLENAIVSTLQHILGNGDNFDTLLDIILDSYNGKLNDLTALRLAEKELAKVEKSLSNLVAAIEAGLLTETTKARLQELEESKRMLSEVIAVEKSKEKKLLTKDDIGLYVQYALSQPNQTLIDLLVSKVVIYNDKIELFLKYTDAPDEPPKRGKHKASENPERNISERGSFLGEYVYEYEVNLNGRKPRIYIPELRKETRYTLVRVLV